MDYIKVGEWIIVRVISVNRRIEALLSNYIEYINPIIVEDLECVLSSEMHTSILELSRNQGGVSFKDCGENFYWDYYELAEKIRKDMNKVES